MYPYLTYLSISLFSPINCLIDHLHTLREFLSSKKKPTEPLKFKDLKPADLRKRKADEDTQQTRKRRDSLLFLDRLLSGVAGGLIALFVGTTFPIWLFIGCQFIVVAFLFFDPYALPEHAGGILKLTVIWTSIALFVFFVGQPLITT